MNQFQLIMIAVVGALADYVVITIDGMREYIQEIMFRKEVIK